MMTTHILKTDFGVTVKMTFDEHTGQMSCEWNGLPKRITRRLEKKILNTYRPWRDQILQSWSERAGKTALLIEI